MRITRQTTTELVVEDSLIWVTVLCAIAAAPLLYIGIAPGMHGTLAGGGLFLFFGLFGVRKMTFAFDGAQRVVRWNGRKLFKVESGSIPFGDITGIGVEAMTSNDSGAAYRLSILTAHGSVPLGFAYGGGKDRHARMREAILAFLNPGAQGASSASTEPASGAGLADEASIRSLLRQGRKIDAVTLLRSTERLSLTEAMRRINAIDAAMKAGK
ncbi:MAG: hypothetical protein ABSE96_02830 [Terracidiphilus sp.]|jgi:hypothetical protein